MIASPFENEYFVREDAERLRKLGRRLRKQLEEAERQRLRSLHWMRCPRCGAELHEAAYRGAVADLCLECHGVFLDERELAHLHAPVRAGVMTGILHWLGPELHIEGADRRP
jgi:hypothetical protein